MCRAARARQSAPARRDGRRRAGASPSCLSRGEPSLCRRARSACSRSTAAIPASCSATGNPPAEEAAAFREEWFIGGDLAEFDADGFVWHRGRNDDIMNAFGYRVSPLEVEKILTSHLDVADVAVAERKVADGVSVIAAFVVPKPGSAPDEAALLAHCAEHLAAYKRPRKVVLVSEIPRTANGKLSRRMLPQVV